MNWINAFEIICYIIGALLVVDIWHLNIFQEGILYGILGIFLTGLTLFLSMMSVKD